MANLTSVTLTAGVPTAGTGTVGTIDNVTGTAGAPSVPVLTVQGVVGGTAQKVDGSAVTQPVSGSVSLTGATNNINNISGTVSLPTGASTAALQPTNAAQGSTTSGQTGHLMQGAVTTAAPTYTTAQTSPLSLDTTGALRVNVTAGGGAGGTSSTVGSAAPSTATAAGFTDGTNMVLAKVRAASSGSAVATDPAVVVTLRDVNANGSATSANSAPVVIASDQSAVKTLTSVTASSNGSTASRVNAAASTNATSLKASAGQLYTIDVFNVAAYNVFLKLYNKASAPTVGTDTPIMTIPVQAGGGYSKTWPMGLTFGTGIAYAITKLQADSDTTVVAAGDLTGNTTWI